MWDPKLFNDKVRLKNMPKRFERADDIVKRATTDKNPSDIFNTLISRKQISLKIVGSNHATPKNKQIKIIVTSYNEKDLEKINPFRP
jgi:hypothetical protein